MSFGTMHDNLISQAAKDYDIDRMTAQEIYAKSPSMFYENLELYIKERRWSEHNDHK